MAKILLSDLTVDTTKKDIQDEDFPEKKIVPDELRPTALAVLAACGLPATRGGLRQLKQRYDQHGLDMIATLYKLAGLTPRKE